MTDSRNRSDSPFIPGCLVSGGQTGVDRAALDVAIALGIGHGGWCPAGRRSEDGTIPSRYELQETESDDYPARTEQNVIDSDATLILYEQALKGGTLLTRRMCRRHNKNHLVIQMELQDVAEVREWLVKVRPQTLNVAGPRESNAQGIHQRASDSLLSVFAT